MNYDIIYYTYFNLRVGGSLPKLQLLFAFCETIKIFRTFPHVRRLYFC